MAPSLTILAVVAVGLIAANAQSPTINDTQTDPGSPAGADFEDNSKRERQGDRYTWEHDIGSGETVSERAFAPNGSSVIVVKSKDRTLESRKITRATSVYYFTDFSALMAIIPWRRSGPCLIKNSSLTYQGAIDLLSARNGSTVLNSSKVAIDGNRAPLTTEEKAVFLESNPGLQRACSRRPIIITVDLRDNPEPFSNSTQEIIALTLEADVTITVPELPDVPDSTTKFEGKDAPQPGEDQAKRWGFKRNELGQGSVPNNGPVA